MFDITTYAALLLRAYQLEERLRARSKELREHPPANVDEYMALAAEIQTLTVELQGLWAEAGALLKSGAVTPGDIQAAHERNQQKWTADV